MVTGELALMSDTQTVKVFCSTSDNWYGTYHTLNGRSQIGLVSVMFSSIPDSELHTEGFWRVSCWGDGDRGLEKDFIEETDAWVCFMQIIGFSDVTQEKCRELGLYPA